MHLAVALDGAGWHPAAWREPAARPTELFTARYWADLVAEAERGLLDLVTIEDGLSLQPGGTDRVRGRLDAVLVASRVAPLTRHVGLVPTVVATHTEPFHIAKAIATLDYVSKGRAGVRVKVSADPTDYGHFGRRQIDPALFALGGDIAGLFAPGSVAADLFDEAGDYVEVLRRLWDSWEDDAEIRDATTGRFIDRDKVHYIDFEGRFFSVKGPSITPRPPQGQPVVAALAHADRPYQFVAESADVGFVTPRDADDARRIAALLPDRLVLGDLVVFIGASAREAEDRVKRLDDLAGEAFTSDAHIFRGTPRELADLVTEWHRAGLAGVRLRPGGLPEDLTAITRGLVPELQQRGLFRTAYEADTLRGLLGLPRPENRYAGTVSS